MSSDGFKVHANGLCRQRLLQPVSPLPYGASLISTGSQTHHPVVGVFKGSEDRMILWHVGEPFMQPSQWVEVLVLQPPPISGGRHADDPSMQRNHRLQVLVALPPTVLNLNPALRLSHGTNEITTSDTLYVAIIVGIVGFHFSPSVWPFVEMAT